MAGMLSRSKLSLSKVAGCLAIASLSLLPALGQETELDFMPPAHAEIVAEMIPEATVLKGGVRFAVVSEGEGDLIEVGDTVEAIYTGRLLDGSIFNQKTGRWHTYTFEVGADPRQIIEGWEIAMPKMKKGGTYRVGIPSQYAYKDKGRPGQVPPYSTVVFEIEILDVR